MNWKKYLCFVPFKLVVICFFIFSQVATGQNSISPDQINFVRQGVARFIFSEDQSLPLSGIYPEEIVGINSMHPNHIYSIDQPGIDIENGSMKIEAQDPVEMSMWFGSFNPFATYTLLVNDCMGNGEVGFEFSDKGKNERFIVSLEFEENKLKDARIRIFKGEDVILNRSVLTYEGEVELTSGKIILQMLGSGLNIFIRHKGLPLAIGQVDFNKFLDLREKKYLRSFQSNLYCRMQNGGINIEKVTSEFSTGLGQADIRAITYKDGSPLFENDRLWYTLSIRGRALPHHIQGVFSLGLSTFDLKLEGIIVFDRGDGLLRNEISSHIFYDREKEIWRGLTTGFSAYADIENEKKQILAIESKSDPRFGFSVMRAEPIGMIGDIEDSHILYDSGAQKWRILTCMNMKGYKAVILESDRWNADYKRIAGPVMENSTGTSIQMIGDARYCFSGSSERNVYIYTYPDLVKAGTLKMDLPPWDDTAGTRIWPNIVEIPDSYELPHKYIGLMMDRYNYPGIKGPNWTYGALYLYYGYDE